MPTRRSFVAGILATGFAPTPTWADAGSPAFLSAGLAPSGEYVLCGLTRGGEIAFQLPLPARGHAAATHPTRPEAVAFARRPGTYAIVLDCLTGEVQAQLNALPGRHFYGHGTFSTDGDVLFTTENDFEHGLGVIGVWDARRGYKRVAEFPSGGIGPHDMVLLPDAAVLAIANGGIETHPETGRTKLNIPTMRPDLSYVSLDGKVVEQLELDPTHHKNSIRHLTVARDGTVAFAMQWQGDLAATPPLLGLHKSGQPARLANAPADATRHMAGYAGSVSISHAQDQVAITSPRGGEMQVFDMTTATLQNRIAIKDVCGVAPSGNGFFVTNGFGETYETAGRDVASKTSHALRWDNHLIPIT